MQNSALFRGFTDSERKKILKCLSVKRRKCNTNETIMLHNEASDNIYVVLTGSAELAGFDYDGNKVVLERFTAGAMFSDMFFNPIGNEHFSVSATSPSEILSFRYSDALFQCENACVHHKKFIDNLFRLVSEKIIAQTQHIELLTKRSIREKLMSYFEREASKNGSFSFSLPMSLSSLADYLNINRSAMQREIRRLNNEGLMQTKGKKVVLIKK